MAKLILKEGNGDNEIFIDNEDKMNFGDVAKETILAYFESVIVESKKIVKENEKIKAQNKKIPDRKKHKKLIKEKEAITVTKFRGILDLTNKIYNRVMLDEENEIASEQISDLAYLKVKLAYESGRDEVVKDFVEKTLLTKPIDHIITCVKCEQKAHFLLYARYLESLIAYFTFYEETYNAQIAKIYANGGIN